MKYISKKEFFQTMLSNLGIIQDLEWGNRIPLSEFCEEGQGVMILQDAKYQIIYASATNNFSRRLDELLGKENINGRFNTIAYVQVAQIDDRSERFFERTHIGHTMKMYDIPFEQLDNVLDDDDPRIIAQESKYVESIQKNRWINPSCKSSS